MSAQKKGMKTWKWKRPKELAAIGALGAPIIAYGKLFAVGEGGAVCFEHSEGSGKSKFKKTSDKDKFRKNKKKDKDKDKDKEEEE